MKDYLPSLHSGRLGRGRGGGTCARIGRPSSAFPLRGCTCSALGPAFSLWRAPQSTHSSCHSHDHTNWSRISMCPSEMLWVFAWSWWKQRVLHLFPGHGCGRRGGWAAGTMVSRELGASGEETWEMKVRSWLSWTPGQCAASLTTDLYGYIFQ